MCAAGGIQALSCDLALGAARLQDLGHLGRRITSKVNNHNCWFAGLVRDLYNGLLHAARGAEDELGTEDRLVWRLKIEVGQPHSLKAGCSIPQPVAGVPYKKWEVGLPCAARQFPSHALDMCHAVADHDAHDGLCRLGA